MSDQGDLFEHLFDGLEDKRDDVEYGKPIATKLDSQKASDLFVQFSRGTLTEAEFDAGLRSCIIREGMTATEIRQHFPPTPQHPDRDYNRSALIKAIILEERRLVGRDRAATNIRNFWYTNLMYTLLKTLGDTNVGSILNTFNRVLTDLVKSGNFRYADLNLVSEKSDLCRAIFRDSPYPNIIIASEKASYHEYLQRLADIFKITFISLGGQGSYQVYEHLVTQFIESGIDIDQEFFIYSVSDFDPAGYDIQQTAKEHLQRAGIRDVTIRRVYLTEDQLTPAAVDRYAIPYEWQKTEIRANKTALTKYSNFGRRTGGIFKVGDRWVRFGKNGDGYETPELISDAQGYKLYRVELDNFEPNTLLQLLIDAIEKDIDGAEYFRQKARLYLADRHTYEAEKAAMEIAADKAKQRIGKYILMANDVKRDIEDAHQEISSEYEDLETAMYESYEGRADRINDMIQELDERIAQLEEQRDELEHDRDSIWKEYDAYDDFLDAVKETEAYHVSEIYAEYLDVEAILHAYIDLAKREVGPELIKRFQDVLDAVSKSLNWSDASGEIFNAARNGATTFDADLTHLHKLRLDAAYATAMEQRREKLEPEPVSLPDPPKQIQYLPALLEDLRKRLEDIEAAELSQDQIESLKQLRSAFLGEDYD